MGKEITRYYLSATIAFPENAIEPVWYIGAPNYTSREEAQKNIVNDVTQFMRSKYPDIAEWNIVHTRINVQP